MDASCKKAKEKQMDKIKAKLKELGLSDEQIDEFVKETINDKFIPKHRFDEVYEKNKQLESDVKDRDTQITNLKKFEGDNATLKTKIEELETANKQKDEENAKAIKDLKIDNAINYALDGKVEKGYADLVLGLINKADIILKDDGTVAGLDEQIEKIKTDKPKLFKEVGEGDNNGGEGKGWSFKGDDPNDSQKQTKKSISENFVNSLLNENKQVSEVTAKASEHYFGKEQ